MRAEKGNGDPNNRYHRLLEVTSDRRFASDRITLTLKAKPFFSGLAFPFLNHCVSELQPAMDIPSGVS
jgi:hypothetical protein